MTRNLFIALALTGCADGTWSVGIWGEDYIETGIPAEDFADGCSAAFTRFEVELTEGSLLDGDLEVAGSVEPARFDLVQPGPQVVGSVDVRATHYDTARFSIAGSDAVHASGALTCGADTIVFDWTFAKPATYLCEADLTVPAGGFEATELTVHGDHLFYDGLEDADAQVRGQAIVDADADGDGTVTQAELAAVPVAGLGYTVGQYSEVTDLDAFITHLTATLGHVDGEGHCQVDL